ncbi:hypothetical protein G7Y89_g2018 [Cudoniella acicularis]|uniref:Uncharacterized protein n=1 Tax=Cudoniella acicularis TaxID=354080 RepID=A0A8H4RVV4_9HELO|nr:hypothetical protein G7Y89_g2018 [Cudoniella acicularis]
MEDTLWVEWKAPGNLLHSPTQSFMPRDLHSPLKALDVIIITQGLEIPSRNWNGEDSILKCLQPLQLLRNVGSFVIRKVALSSEVPDVIKSLLKNQSVADSFHLEDEPALEAEIGQLVKSNQPVEFLVEMHNNCASYATPFERSGELSDNLMERYCWHRLSNEGDLYRGRIVTPRSGYSSRPHRFQPAYNALYQLFIAVQNGDGVKLKQNRRTVIEAFKNQYQRIGEAVLLLENYFAAFRLQTQQGPTLEFRIQLKMEQKVIERYYSLMPAEIPIRELNYRLNEDVTHNCFESFQKVVDNLDSQFLKTRKARKEPFEWDWLKKPECTIGINEIQGRLDEMINWAAKEPLIGPELQGRLRKPKEFY